MTLPREGESLDYTTRDYLLTDFSKYPPLGLMAIATQVDRRHEISIYDPGVQAHTIEDACRHILKVRPDVLGISVVTRRLWALKEISCTIKAQLPQCRIIVGGPHINYWPRETLELGNIDYALSGCSESSFPRLIEEISAGEKRDRLDHISQLHCVRERRVYSIEVPESSHVSLDQIPFPRRDLIPQDLYFTAVDMSRMATTYSSRGCPFHCIFCDVQEKGFAFRSGRNMADEFEALCAQGYEEIHIFDDAFNIRKDRVIELCNELQKRRIRVKWSVRARVNPWDREMMQAVKEQGCVRIHVGVESLDDATLRYMKKRQSVKEIMTFFSMCNDVGIDTLAYFIIGFPTETPAYRASLYEKALELNPTYAFVNILFPLARTEYYESLVRTGVYGRDHWKDYVVNPTPYFNLPLPRSVELQRELESIADSFHRRFCFRPSFLGRELARAITSPRRLLRKARLALILARETMPKPHP